jgi:small subunit ribosomal protein S18
MAVETKKLRRRGRGFRRRKVCRFCAGHAEYVDYKDVETLRNFTTERGKIIPRRISGNCASHQRMLSRAIKRSRNIALISFVSD